MTFISSKKVLSCSPIYSYQPRQHRTTSQHVTMQIGTKVWGKDCGFEVFKEWKKEVVGLSFSFKGEAIISVFKGLKKLKSIDLVEGQCIYQISFSKVALKF
jgi:hypothetical protein